MADLVIRGVEMPIDCHSCWMRVYCFERGIGIWGCGKGNPCPLVPLPEGHGRLIDADALDDALIKLAGNECSPKVFASWLTYEENAPTIVPAEGGGEDG